MQYETEYKKRRGTGWRTFAGVMLLIVGFLNFIDALVGLTNSTYYQNVENTHGINLPITNHVHTWGWVELGLSIVLLGAGLSVLSLRNALISRTIGVAVVSANIFFQLAYLAHFPFWSFTMIIIDILILYGLVARVDGYESA